MWKNLVQPDGPEDDNIIWRMRVDCWISKATGTHSDYVIIVGFALQQGLGKRSSLLCYSTSPALFVMCYAGTAVCDELTSPSDESNWLCVSNCV